LTWIEREVGGEVFLHAGKQTINGRGLMGWRDHDFPHLAAYEQDAAADPGADSGQENDDE
jgi:hypothetical protein